MLPKIALFINGRLGFTVLRKIQDTQLFELKVVVMNAPKKQSPEFEAKIKETVNNSVEILTWDVSRIESLANMMREYQIDYAISALFGHILPAQIIDTVKTDFINLHPSLLPLGRGAHPIPWAIIGGNKQGITIHKLDRKLDSGEIYIQKEIPTNISMNAAVIYEKAMKELELCLSDFLPIWSSQKFTKVIQNESISTLNASANIEKIRTLRFDEFDSVENFIKRIQALDFNESGSALYLDRDGKKWSIKIAMEET